MSPKNLTLFFLWKFESTMWDCAHDGLCTNLLKTFLWLQRRLLLLLFFVTKHLLYLHIFSYILYWAWAFLPMIKKSLRRRLPGAEEINQRLRHLITLEKRPVWFLVLTHTSSQLLVIPGPVRSSICSLCRNLNPSHTPIHMHIIFKK